MRRRRLALTVVIVTAAAGLSGCGGGGGPVPSITTRTVGKLGPVLTTAAGDVLYVYAPDSRLGVTCLDECADVWPPLKIAAGKSAIATGSVSAGLLGSDKDRQGGRVVTYRGWPLYTYQADGGPGVASGQAIDLNGGFWYVMAADGRPVVPAGTPPLPGS